MCKGAKSAIGLTLNSIRILMMLIVADDLQYGVAGSMLKKGEGGWCAWSCFGLRCFGGAVSWRRRGGFSSCNTVSGVMFKNTRDSFGDVGVRRPRHEESLP